MTFNFENLSAPDFHHEAVFEDATQIAALMGIEIHNIYYSGFWSQGDGACFVGDLGYAKGCAKNVKLHAPKDKELHDIAERWQDLQSKYFYKVDGKVTHTGPYYHSNSVSFDFYDHTGELPESFFDKDEDEAMSILTDFMGWIYDQLEVSYDFHTAFEWAKELEDSLEELALIRSEVRALVKGVKQECPVEGGTLRSLARSELLGLAREWRHLRRKVKALHGQFHYYDQDNKSWTLSEFFKANH